MPEAKNTNPVRIIQFTDIHFFEDPSGRLMGVDTAESFADVLTLANKAHGTPDYYLLTGDLSQDETPGSYQRLADTLTVLQADSYYLPGNHDRRQVMREAFNKATARLRPERSFTAGNWVIVLLDTLVESEVHGHLSKEELTHLDTELSKHNDKHALVCLHHHPVPMKSRWIDEIGVDNADDFLAVIDKHANVRGILWGHVHQQFDSARNGVQLMSTPSTCVQFKPLTDAFAADGVPPGYRYLELFANGKIGTEVNRLKAVARGFDLQSAGY